MHILLVENSEIDRLIAQALIVTAGHQIDMAHNYEEVMTLVQHRSYDLILMDLHTPGVSGIEIAKTLRRNKKFQSTPIVALTRNAYPEEIKAWGEAGIQQFLSKPLTYNTLEAVIGPIEQAILQQRAQQ